MSVLRDLAFVTKLNPLWFVENHSFDLNDIIVFHIDRFLQAVFSNFFLCFGHLGICSNSIFECFQNNRLPFSNELYKKLWLHVFLLEWQIYVETNEDYYKDYLNKRSAFMWIIIKIWLLANLRKAEMDEPRFNVQCSRKMVGEVSWLIWKIFPWWYSYFELYF